MKILQDPRRSHPRKPRDDVIFSGESLLQEPESPWELTLTEQVPEVVEFRLADWPEKYFSGQSARSSIRLTLSPSYRKLFSSSIDIVAWPVQRRFAHHAKFQKLFNNRGEIRSNHGYSTSFPCNQTQQCRNRVH